MPSSFLFWNIWEFNIKSEKILKVQKDGFELMIDWFDKSSFDWTADMYARINLKPATRPGNKVISIRQR